MRKHVDVADGLEPLDVTGVGALLHLAEEPDGLGLKARFGWIIPRDNRIDDNADDGIAAFEPQSLLDVLAFEFHRSPVQEVDRYQFRRLIIGEPRPDGLDGCSVRQRLFHLDRGVRLRSRAFSNQDSVNQARDRLPLRNSSFPQSLGGMDPDDVAVCRNSLLDSLKERTHRHDPDFKDQTHLTLPPTAGNALHARS